MDNNGNVFIGGYFQNSADFDPGPESAILTSSFPNSTDIFIAKYNKATVWYLDEDNDGWYIETQASMTSPGPGWTSESPSGGNGDCDDNDASVYQTFPFYPDADGDGHGAYTAVETCAESANTPPVGYLTTNDDCDDNDHLIWLAKPAEIVLIQDTILTCHNAAPFTVEVTPAGGTWSGAGINNGAFSPMEAGIGSHTLTYFVAGDSACVLPASDYVVVTVATCISVSEDEAETMMVYPTQTSGTINIQAQNLNSAMLMDMNGRLINTFHIQGTNAVLNIETYSTGFYLLSISNDTTTRVFKVVKE